MKKKLINVNSKAFSIDGFEVILGVLKYYADYKQSLLIGGLVENFISKSLESVNGVICIVLPNYVKRLLLENSKMHIWVDDKKNQYSFCKI